MRNKLLSAIIVLAIIASVGRAASTDPASSFPVWAMKAYPDDITRLMRFDRVKEAETVGLKSVEELAGDPDKTPDYIQALASLSHLYLALNRTAEAQKYLDTGLHRLSTVKLEGKDKELDIARALLEEVQSSIAQANAQPDRAAEFAITAFERLQKNLPATDPRVVDQVLEVEHFKIRAADHQPLRDAIPTFTAARNIYLNQFGRSSAPVADVYMSMGYYYLNTGSVGQAQTAFQSALTIRQTIYGENSEVASSLEALALIDAGSDRFEQALNRLRQARAMTLKVIGEDDPAVAGIDMETAAVLDRSKGDTAEAERLLLKASAVFEKYSQTREELAQTLDMLADHYHLAADETKAAKAHDRAEAIRADLKKRQDL